MRRWLVYIPVAAAAFLLLFAVAIAARTNPIGLFVAQLIILPLAATIVYVYAGADALCTLDSAALRWERIAERGWAIILIDFGITIAQITAYQAMTGGGDLALAMGALVLFMATMLMYAEPFAAMEAEVNQVMLLPMALMRSMMLAWINIPRVCGFFALQLAWIGLTFLMPSGGKNPSPAIAAADAASAAISTVVFALLFTAAYVETLAQERDMVS